MGPHCRPPCRLLLAPVPNAYLQPRLASWPDFYQKLVHSCRKVRNQISMRELGPIQTSFESRCEYALSGVLLIGCTCNALEHGSINRSKTISESVRSKSETIEDGARLD